MKALKYKIENLPLPQNLKTPIKNNNKLCQIQVKFPKSLEQ